MRGEDSQARAALITVAIFLSVSVLSVGLQKANHVFLHCIKMLLHTNRFRFQIRKEEPGTIDIIKYLSCRICMCVMAHLMGALPLWVTGQRRVKQTLQTNTDVNWGGGEEWLGHFLGLNSRSKCDVELHFTPPELALRWCKVYSTFTQTRSLLTSMLSLMIITSRLCNSQCLLLSDCLQYNSKS